MFAVIQRVDGRVLEDGQIAPVFESSPRIGPGLRLKPRIVVSAVAAVSERSSVHGGWVAPVRQPSPVRSADEVSLEPRAEGVIGVTEPSLDHRLARYELGGDCVVSVNPAVEREVVLLRPFAVIASGGVVI